ncbi:MAG: NfeD family protein [Leptolyngbya sp.]|nr:NfeD family protein [Leptolyngbya sp.]
MAIYGLSFIFGGIFVLLAAIGGLDGADIDTDFDLDLDSPVPDPLDDVDVGTQIDQTLTALRSRWWLPLLSLRFWTFALCFFGLTGLLITLLTPSLSPWLTGLIAMGMGIFCGWVAAVVLRSLSRQPISSMVKPESLIGQVGEVEIPFDQASRGKVKIVLGDSTVSYFAITQEERAFALGDSVLVVGMEHGKLWVASAEEVGD